MSAIPHNNKLSNVFPLSVVLFTNVLFLAKYLPRYSNYTGLLIAFYVLFAAGAYIVWMRKNEWFSYTLVCIALLLVCLGSVIGFRYVPVEKLNVDRWNVIYTFFDAVKKGVYPYGVRSNMSNLPGPMPLYFLLAYPFYLIKEIGYMPLLALVMLCYYQYQKSRRSGEDNTFALLVLLLSPFMLWEIFARSTLFFISVLWYIYADWLLSVENKEKGSKMIIPGLVGGLLLSTRFIYVLLLGIYGIYFLRNKVRFSAVFVWGISIVAGLLITLLPMYLLYPKDFLANNPFQTESLSYIPFWANFLFPFAAIAMGFVLRNKERAILFSGLVLLLVVVVYFGFRTMKDGWTNAFYNSYADISYFIIPIPFFLAVLHRPLELPNKKSLIEYD